MKSEDHRGNLTLDELNKIIFLSNKLDTYDVNSNNVNLNEELDSLGRKIIKNKYRILDSVYKQNIV